MWTSRLAEAQASPRPAKIRRRFEKPSHGEASQALTMIQKNWVGCYKEANKDEASAQTFCLKVDGDQISLDSNTGLEPYVFGISKPLVSEPNEMKVSAKRFSMLTNDGNSLTLRKDVYKVNQAGATILDQSMSYTYNLVPGETRQSDKITQVYMTSANMIEGTKDTKHSTHEYVRQ
jgi:hypothetical protein